MKRMQLVAILIAAVYLQVFVSAPFLAEQLGGAYVVVGWLGGAGQFSYALASLLLHGFVRRFGEQRMLRIVLPALAICAALFAVVPNIPVLFVVFIALSVILALFWVSMECLFSGFAREASLLRRMSRYCISFSLGDVIGAWLGTALVELDIRLPFVAAALLVMVCWGLLYWLERTGHLCRDPSPTHTADETLHGGERFLPASRTLFFFVCALMGITFLFVPLVVTKEFPDWQGVSGRIIALQPLLQVVIFWSLGRWDRWVHKSWPLWVCGLIGIAATTLIVAALGGWTSPAVGAVCIRLGLCLVGTTLAISFLMNLLYSLERPETRARNSGIHECIVGAGMCLGPIVAGYGARAAGGGIGAFWAGLALISCGLISAMVVWFVTKRRVVA